MRVATWRRQYIWGFVWAPLSTLKQAVVLGVGDRPSRGKIHALEIAVGVLRPGKLIELSGWQRQLDWAAERACVVCAAPISRNGKAAKARLQIHSRIINPVGLRIPVGVVYKIVQKYKVP